MSPKPPNIHSQIDEYGSFEKIDVSIYNHRVLCDESNCMNIRYVKSQDRTTVKKCKFHARQATLRKRALRAKAYRAKAKLK